MSSKGLGYIGLIFLFYDNEKNLSVEKIIILTTYIVNYTIIKLYFPKSFAYIYNIIFLMNKTSKTQ